jgi:hypothetical protein
MPAARTRRELPIAELRDRRSASTSASAEEAAAIVAALERFMRSTAPPPAPAAEDPGAWQRAAILEGVERECHADLFDPWINT